MKPTETKPKIQYSWEPRPWRGSPRFTPPKKTGTFHLVSFRFVQVTGF
ncbi:hypothetical protein HMPREF9278_0466 [Mobiluncus mulieris FB024-16]|nr:hypothetical protein HMPREF9278_0466 [Mobiluncus mulieris FB024-16]